MDLIGRLLGRIPGTKAHAHRRLDVHLAVYTARIREAKEQARRERVLEAILAQDDAPPPPAPAAPIPGTEYLDRTTDAWLAAILRSSFVATDRTLLRTRLADFTRELARWLLDPVSARLSPELIGRQLAHDLELSTPALRHTLEVLAPFAEQVHEEFGGSAPEQRARLLGGLAEGFTDGARRRILDEQKELSVALDRARRTEHEKLAASEARFEQQFADSQLGMCLLDADGVITKANPALRLLLGRPEDLIVGQPLWAFVPEDAQAREVEQACHDAAAHLHTTVLDEIEVSRRDDPVPRWVSVTVRWMSKHDRDTGHAHVVLADVTTSHQRHLRLDQVGSRDDTTDLPNRQCLERRLDDVLDGAGPTDTVGLCVVGLDGLDKISEELGSEVGENLVRLLAARLRGAVGGAVDMVARHDSATFCAVVTDPAVWNRMDELVAHVDSWLGETVHMGKYDLAVKPRIGIVRASHSSVTSGQLLRSAEQALRQSAEPVHRGVFVATRSDEGRHNQLLAELPAAVRGRQLELAYAPITDPGTGRVMGVEASVQWRHPTRGLFSADHLLVLADEIGLDLALTSWILNHSAEQSRKWAQSLGSTAPYIVVNVPRCLVHGDQLVEDVRQVLLTTRAQPEHLRLALNQTGTPMPHGVRAEHLMKLSALGISLRLNDFGSSFQRFDLLPQVTFEGIAIPPGLTSGLGGDSPGHKCSRDITTALISMAKALKLNVTLQGVSTDEQVQAAQTMGATLIQGPLVGPPESAQDVWRRVRSNGQQPAKPLVEAS
ncbi:EAL domain-containing protein [Nocardia sp. NRRL S-836]|uniref:EAL domain-containing protein n=1 Tax=Nocardia sp. NRRL S-836 TaxID=1519492 RepID=UPI0006AE995F|nr:EAL domain-containing protein [Nocardia sp. NRRL S-836]KOV84119.1 hypothetical protein ADL03_17865 [Nocardia sp. NRRL S-836]